MTGTLYRVVRHAAGQHLHRGAEHGGVGGDLAGRLFLPRHGRERVHRGEAEQPGCGVSAGAVGSSPGGAGALQRYDYSTDQISLVNVWPERLAWRRRR